MTPLFNASSRSRPHNGTAGSGHKRPPNWIVVNYMLAKGFEEQGMHDWAARIRKDSGRLIGEHGFHEAFSPVTGEGTGGSEFSWTAAMWLAWCGEKD